MVPQECQGCGVQKGKPDTQVYFQYFFHISPSFLIIYITDTFAQDIVAGLERRVKELEDLIARKNQ